MEQSAIVWPNIGDVKNMSDWYFILLAILIIDIIVLFLTRYLPDILGKNLNVWYDRFTLSAVISDVFIIAIGFALARYAYSYFYPDAAEPFHLWAFLGLLVGIQVLHDLIFYFFVIKPLPEGHNRMMDIFKAYSGGGAKIIAGDAAMMVGSAFIAMSLKVAEPSVVAFIALLSVYTLPYILETKNKYSER